MAQGFKSLRAVRALAAKVSCTPTIRCDIHNRMWALGDTLILNDGRRTRLAYGTKKCVVDATSLEVGVY